MEQVLSISYRQYPPIGIAQASDWSKSNATYTTTLSSGIYMDGDYKVWATTGNYQSIAMFFANNLFDYNTGESIIVALLIVYLDLLL